MATAARMKEGVILYPNTNDDCLIGGMKAAICLFIFPYYDRRTSIESEQMDVNGEKGGGGIGGVWTRFLSISTMWVIIR